ncbi:MAG: hypothetical protein JW839_04280 [Candidatus Lokiarchaeota archaeon]|nr:hypothetical protein [Candidatus Lokiarchaeota archaeon]
MSTIEAIKGVVVCSLAIGGVIVGMVMVNSLLHDLGPSDGEALAMAIFFNSFAVGAICFFAVSAIRYRKHETRSDGEAGGCGKVAPLAGQDDPLSRCSWCEYPLPEPLPDRCPNCGSTCSS